MNPADLFAAGVGFVAGGAAIWFGKTWMLTVVQGSEKVIAKMKADVATLEAKAAAVKAAVTK